MERLLTISEVSKLLNVKKATLRAWIYRCKIPVVRVGRLVRFRESDLERWLKK